MELDFKMDYKYVHVLYRNELHFNKNFVDIINNSNIKASEHIFVTPHVTVWKSCKDYENVYLMDNVNYINYFGKRGKWIFLHSLKMKKSKFIFTRIKYAKRVIWRTWGDDVEDRDLNTAKSFIRRMLLKLTACRRKKIIRNFFAISGANVIDEDSIKQNYGSAIRFIKLDYSFNDKIKNILNKGNIEKREDLPCVMIGHSGFSMNKHIEVINMLKKFDGKIKILLVLAYGDKNYIKFVKEEACKIFNDIMIIEQKLPYDGYIKLLSEVDIAILPGKWSYALGNINILSNLCKKIYLERDGVIAKSVSKHNIVVNDYKQIENQDLNEFLKVDENDLNKMKSLYGVDEGRIGFQNTLQKLFQELDNERKKV